jgi:hypothetical protein
MSEPETTTDAAALIAEAREALKYVKLDEENHRVWAVLLDGTHELSARSDAHARTLAFLVPRLASALEAALERETRLREALQSVRGWLKEPSEPLIAFGVANHALGDAP